MIIQLLFEGPQFFQYIVQGDLQHRFPDLVILKAILVPDDVLDVQFGNKKLPSLPWTSLSLCSYWTLFSLSDQLQDCKKEQKDCKKIRKAFQINCFKACILFIYLRTTDTCHVMEYLGRAVPKLKTLFENLHTKGNSPNGISFSVFVIVNKNISGIVYPETFKYWVGIQRGQFYLMGRRCLFSLGWPPF